jgi:hypothetical protein
MNSKVVPCQISRPVASQSSPFAGLAIEVAAASFLCGTGRDQLPGLRQLDSNASLA